MPNPSTALRRQRSREEVHRFILDEAEALLADCGEAAFSIRKLVARCGYTAPTIYHHFGDKGHLIAEVLEGCFAALVVELRRQGSGLDDPVDQLRSCGLAFARFGLSHPAHYRLLTASPSAEVEAPPSAEECRQLLSAPLDRLAESGRVPPARLEVLRQAFWALIHGAVSLQVIRSDYDWDEAMLEVALDGLIAGTVDRGEERPNARVRSISEGAS